MPLERFVKTKIVATLGPATQTPERLAGLIEAGVNVFRLNMSHMDHPTAEQLIGRVRRLSHRVALLVDIQGPKMRLTDVAEPFELERGARLPLRAGADPSAPEGLFVEVPDLLDALQVGHHVLVDDGLVRLRVAERLGPGALVLEALTSGVIKGRKGVAAPDSDYQPSVYLDDQDRADLAFAARQEVDFVAASYVTRAADIAAVREVLAASGGDVAVVAKIETRVGVRNIDEIVAAADAVMVARGDLGVEMPPEEVPLIQKRLIKACNEASKPVVVATQMLESMVANPVASRAETSDVANAILDGTDAVMLSAETSVGRYPIEAVRTVSRISEHVESEVSLFREDLFRRPSTSKVEFVSKAAARAAAELQLDALVAFTSSGFTARHVSAYRPRVPIIVTTPHDRVVRRLALQYGVYSLQAEHVGRYDVMLHRNLLKLVRKDILREDQRIAVIGGVPAGRPGSTNMLHVGTVEELMND